VSRGSEGRLVVRTDPFTATNARRLAFTRGVTWSSDSQPTWQTVLENGWSADLASRKDPKYATHGLHTYKGKFYPQLAKGLLNITGIGEGGLVLDPFRSHARSHQRRSTC
jgi:hypothetical protein